MLGSTYTIERELGGGGMSRVYIATEAALGRRVVVKVLPPEVAAGVKVERFKREIQFLARLHHPHIVPLLAAGGDSGLSYYVMPFMEGESLRARMLRRGMLPATEVVRTLREVASGLSFAHHNGIIHRDIKPENILLTDRGRVKLVDFGLAKAVPARQKMSGATAADSLTESGTVMGTLSYMSPEQLRGEPLDERSDIFSFGIVLYEMIIGDLPFIGANSFEVAASILKDPALEIGIVPAGLPQGIKHVVARLLAKRRTDRYSSLSEVKQALAKEHTDPPEAAGAG